VRVVLPNNFTPRAYQRRFMAYFDRGGRRAMWVVHRRGGKDLTALHQTCKMMHKRKGAYWHVFPIAEQARKAIWEGFTKDGQRIMEQVFPASIRATPRNFLPSGEMVVTLKCGSTWRLMGSDKMEVVGAGPVGVTFSEFALAKPTTWNLIRPMLRENDGWASFITTPRGNNHAKKLFDVAKKDSSWFCELQTLFDTRAYDPERTIAEERAEGMPEPLIRQEYLCDWTAANVGAVWGDLVEALEKRGGLEVFEHETDGVFTSWDLGVSDATSIWAWRPRGDGVEVLNHYSAHGQPLSHYFDKLDEWAATEGYRYAKHWLPHDARARTLATGSSVQDRFLERYGSGLVAIGPGLSLLDGIQAARWLLQREGTRIHPRCGEGVEALRAYRYAYDEDRKTFSDKPLHDWASHDADAFRYAAVVARHSELLTRKPEPRPSRPPAVAPSEAFTLDELFEANQGPRSRGRI
jgi:phage terminase large subunit